MSYEVECITRMVQVGAVRKYEHTLKPEFFNGVHREIYGALLTYEQQYGTVMDEATFRMQWPNFLWSPSDTQVEWYADELSEDYAGEVATKIIEDYEATSESFGPKLAARQTLLSLIDKQKYFGAASKQIPDLLEHSLIRLDHTPQRVDQLVGATTGFKYLDDVTGGTSPGEIELYVARPGVGKTFMLLYSGYASWEQQGKKIIFVSPEMSIFEIGRRFDSHLMHVSQRRLFSGIRDDERDMLKELLDDLIAKHKVPFKFVSAQENGRRFNVADIRNYAQECDLLLIDGLLFIEPSQPSKDVRTRLLNLMDEMKDIVVTTNVAMRATHQANRQTDVLKKKNDERVDPVSLLPDLHHLAESGATEQFANRVITMKDIKGRLYVALRKNRNGPSGRIFSVVWDFDRQIITDERLEGDEAGNDPDQQTVIEEDKYPF